MSPESTDDKPADLGRNLLLLAFSLLFAFTVCELGARALLPAPKGIFVRKESEQQKYVDAARKNPVELTLAVHPEQGGLYMETDKGRRLRPNTKVVVEEHLLSKKRVEIQTNELGYRHGPMGAKQGTRFLFLGDSVTLADYLPYDESFPGLLASMAKEKGKNWEIINAAVGAISLENELAILLDTGLGINPDVVVLNFYLNDFSASPGVYLPPVPESIRWSRFLHYGHLIFTNYMASIQLETKPLEEGLNLEAWRTSLEAKLPLEEGDFRINPKAFNKLILKNLRRWGGSWSEEAWTRMTPFFETLADLARNHNFQLVIVIHPVRYQVEAQQLHDYPQKKLKALTEGLGVPALDLLPMLRYAWRKEATPLFFDHCHHTPHGSKVVAAALERFLSDEHAP